MPGAQIGRAARLSAGGATGGTTTSLLPYDRSAGYAGIVSPTNDGTGFTRTVAALIASRGYVGRFVPSRNMRIVSMSFCVSTAAGSDDAVDVAILDAPLTTMFSNSGATLGKLNVLGVRNCVLLAPVTLTAGTVYYAGLSCGTIGTTAPSLEVAGVGSANATDLFGATAGLREFGIKAAAHPLSAPFVPQVTTFTPVIALIEG